MKTVRAGRNVECNAIDVFRVLGQLMMNELETHWRPPGGRLREQLAAEHEIGAQLGKCLIVSSADGLRQSLFQAAGDAGWDPVVCGDLAGATMAVQRVRFQLAWVDLKSWDRDARKLCESIARLRHVLLVICGNADNAAEEIWARQLGAWLYLPDVAWEDVGDLAFLCEQARIVAGDRPVAT